MTQENTEKYNKLSEEHADIHSEYWAKKSTLSALEEEVDELFKKMENLVAEMDALEEAE